MFHRRAVLVTILILGSAGPLAAQPAPPDPAPTLPPVTVAPDTTGSGPDTDATNAPPPDEREARPSPPLEYSLHDGLLVRAGKVRLRFFVGIETVLLYGHCSAQGDTHATFGTCEASDLLTTHIRRARFETEARLPHHLWIRFALQVKNEIIVLKQASLSWKDHGTTLTAGFLKPPGGLERDSSTWSKPFPERSVVANFKQDRVLGVEIGRWNAAKTFRFQAAAGRPPAGNFDAFEPEDVVTPPAVIEPEDLTTDPGNWDLFVSTVYAPSPRFELGLNATTHIAPDAGRGPNFAEPYETQILRARYFSGAMVAGGFDVSAHADHLRASAEAVFYRSGDTIPQRDAAGDPTEPLAAPQGVAANVTLGYTPSGEYGPAIDLSPLRRGWQLLLRGELLTVTPGVTDDTTAKFGALTGGFDWQVHPQLRLQTDLSIQKFNEAVADNNHNALREYLEVWAQVIM